MSAEPRKSNGGYASKLGSGAIQKQERGLLGLEGDNDALENLPNGIRKLVVGRCHGPHVGDRS